MSFSHQISTLVYAHYRLAKVFPAHFAEVLDSFQEAIKCLSEFACNISFSEISGASIRLIKQAADLVSKNTELINRHNSEDDLSLTEYETQKVWVSWSADFHKL